MRARTTPRVVLPASAVALCLLLISCSKKESESGKPAASSTSAAQAADGGSEAPGGAAQPSPAKQKKKTILPGMALGHPHPVGPTLLIAAGQSLGAIRAGTNLKTLARHMEGPCDIRTEDRCIYVKQASEFTLDDGIVVGIKVHRRDRLVPTQPEKDEHRYFGTFNGGMLPKVMLGLHQHIMIEEYGEPEKKEPLSGKNGEVERHFYDGVIFEYDRLDNGNTVLSAIELILPDPPPGVRASAAEKPAPL